MRVRWLCTLAGLLGVSCASGTQPAAVAKSSGKAACHYEVELVADNPATLDVQLECSGFRLEGLKINERPSGNYIQGVLTSGGSELSRDGERFLLPEPADEIAVSYRVDLEAVAREADNFDVAKRVGSDLMSTASTWLLSPSPDPGGIPVTVHVRTPAPVRFVAGLTRDGDAYHLESQEIPVSTYTVFTKSEPTALAFAGPPPTKKAGGAELEVMILDGQLSAKPAEIHDWIRRSARAVADFWQGFPTPRALVVVVPVPGRHGVVFGKVLPESSPGIAILLGEHTRAKELDEDWVLVHELFHLGFPSFNGEGKWLDEGLATYYEPIIRARAGFQSELDVWQEFSRAMPGGLDALTTSGLENTKNYRAIYWGGAVVSLQADVTIRRGSGGRRGLEDGLGRVLERGGNASEVWSLADVVKTSDEAVGGHALSKLWQAHGRRGSPVDLDALWRQLGVVRTGGEVRLDDGAPLAFVRRAIISGGPAGPKR